VFDGTKDSQYAPLRRKVSNAFEHGAAAVVFCTDDFAVRENLSRTRQKWHEAIDRLVQENDKLKQVKEQRAKSSRRGASRSPSSPGRSKSGVRRCAPSTTRCWPSMYRAAASRATFR